jgi:hypothetical protein
MWVLSLTTKEVVVGGGEMSWGGGGGGRGGDCSIGGRGGGTGGVGGGVGGRKVVGVWVCLFYWWAGGVGVMVGVLFLGVFFGGWVVWGVWGFCLVVFWWVCRFGVFCCVL